MTPGVAALRPMRWWDVEPLLPIEQELFTDDPWSAEAFWSELAGVPETRFYLVAANELGLIGYAGLQVVGTTADVQTVGVAPAAQKCGVGAQLTEALLVEARRRGCSVVLLEVRAENERAQRLYRRFGFTQIGVRRGYYQPGNVDAIVMRLMLS